MYEKLFHNASLSGHSESYDSMLIRGPEISMVGSFSDCRNESGKDCQVIDCRGAEIIPGFIDSHCHLIETGEAIMSPDIQDKDSSELLYSIGQLSHRNYTGYPLIVMGLSDRQFRELRHYTLPASEEGILIFHNSGHCAIADKTGAETVGFNVSDGIAVIDEPYEDPGILMILQKRKREDANMQKYAHAAIEAYHERGVTSLQDNTWDHEVFRYLNSMITGMDLWCWSKGQSDFPYSELKENIEIGPAKFFIDGAFYNRTAWLKEPYGGSEEWCGAGIGTEEIIRRIEPLIAAGRQCAFHAEGDRAISELCDAMENLHRKYPWAKDMRNRIEHAQLIDEKDFSRIRELGMVISAQPEACGDPERDIELLGEERARKAYPHKKIIDEEIPLAFGSDYPYERDFDPFRGMEKACNRSLGDTLNKDTALAAYTSGSAYAGFAEQKKGKLEKGFQADFFIKSEKWVKESVRSVYSRGFSVYEKSLTDQ